MTEGRALVAPLTLSLALVALDSMGEGELSPRAFAGTAIVFVVLGVVADKNPGLAESFAWLIVIGQALSRGPRVAARLNATVRGGGPVEKAGPPPLRVVQGGRVAG